MRNTVRSRLASSMIAAAVMVAGVPGHPVFAQASDAGLAGCAVIEAEAARLACYDRILRATRPPEPAAAVGAPGAAGADDAPAPAPAPVETAIQEFPQTRAERRAARRAEREEGVERFSVIVVSFRENLSGLGVFVTEAGEIYDQVSVERSRFPAAPFAAALETASRNSYWLSTESGGRPVRVVLRN